MLKSERVQYYARDAKITGVEEADLMRGLMGSCGISGDEIDEKISWEMNGVQDERKVRHIAEKFKCKIIAVEVIEAGSEYGVIYDDDIEATYDENYEIVSQQFLMNDI